MNVVMTDQGGLIEVQGTAEGTPFSMQELHALLQLATQGTQSIFAGNRRWRWQHEYVSDSAACVCRANA